MSHKLNNFWDDCKETDLKLELKSKELNHSTLYTKRTNQISSLSTTRKTPSLIKTKKSIHPNIKYHSRINNNIKRYNFDYNSRNRYKLSNACLSSSEIKLKKNLSECTFFPKLISDIKDKNLLEKLTNYSKFTMYERGKIFEMKKKEDNNRKFYEQNEKKNKKYSFKPSIHKCPSFKNVIFNENNYDSLNYFYSRMHSAREYKLYKNMNIPFGLVNYEEIYQNYKNILLKNRKKKDNCIKCVKKNKLNNNSSSNSALIKRIFNEKEAKLCRQDLHKALMNLKLTNHNS